MKIGSVLDLIKNELRNAKSHILSSDPGGLGAGDEGLFWYNSTGKRIKWWSGSAVIDPTDRSTHSGTQTAASISDLATVVKAYRRDEFAAPNTDMSMASHKLTNLLDPTSAQDAATKNYVDSAVQGFSWKQLPVKVATTAAGTLTSSFADGQTVDGVTLVTSDRILIKNQASGQENGIYTVNASGAPTRATDADSTSELRNATVWISQGTTQADTAWNQTAEVTTVGTTAQTWAQVGGGTTFTGGAGLTLTGNTFAVGQGTGVVVGTDDVGIDTSVVMRKGTFTITGDGTTTDFTVTHNLGNSRPTVTIWNEADKAVMMVDITNSADSTSAFHVVFGIAPANATTFKVTVGG